MIDHTVVQTAISRAWGPSHKLFVREFSVTLLEKSTQGKKLIDAYCVAYQLLRYDLLERRDPIAHTLSKR